MEMNNNSNTPTMRPIDRVDLRGGLFIYTNKIILKDFIFCIHQYNYLGGRYKTLNANYKLEIYGMIKKLYWYLFVYDLNEPVAKAVNGSDVSWRKKLINDLSSLVLFSYCLLIFNAVIPVIADALAHTFWEKEHLANEHRLHGKDHVQLEISKSEKQADQSKSSANAKTGTEDFTHILSFSLPIHFPGYRIITRVYPGYQFFLHATYPGIDYPPPRV